MKYKVEEYVDLKHWDSSRRLLNVLQECQMLGNVFLEVIEDLETLDPEHRVFKQKFVQERLTKIRALKKQEEAKKKQLAEKRKKEREQAKVKKAVMDKLTHEELVAFGLVKGK